MGPKIELNEFPPLFLKGTALVNLSYPILSTCEQ